MTGQTGSPQQVGPVGITLPTSPVRPVPWTGQTGLAQNRGVHTQPSSVHSTDTLILRVSLHHFPPLCIPADELNTAGAEVNV